MSVKLDAVNWRTPNDWWFVAMCQNCGLVVSSISDGGAALSALVREHEEAK